jgi:membrane protein implicated in regulation of membrane protease activity
MAMDFELLYWHWIVVGIVLMLTEIFIGSFFIFWFGAAAVATGLFVALIPSLSAVLQVVTWGMLSTGLAVAWFKYLKPLSNDRTKAGLSKEALVGEIGQIINAPNGDSKGLIRFPAPLLGNDEWLIISEDSLAIGDRVSVIDLSGNALIVKKT